MSHRRAFLQRMAALPLFGRRSAAAAALAAPALAARRDYFSELGVTTFINAAGTYTTLTASLMPPEAVQAIEYASRNYVSLTELQDKVGERIASMIGCEAALVTSGAAGALTCGTAGCVTGTDQKAIRQLPDLTGLRSEVIIQKSHRYGYDHAVRAVGITMVEVETAEELERAVNPKTAMMLFFNDADPRGQIRAADFVALGKKHSIPTFNDAAADTPPVENLSKYTKMGFDLVTFSGGKGIRGPQSAGLLLGRRDLIQAARLNTSPYSDSISRGCKVNKEEMLAMLVALELFMKRDHAADFKEYEKRTRIISDAVRDVPTVQTEVWVPEIANHVPHLKIRWDQSRVAISPREVLKRLRTGKPAIEANPSTNEQELVIGVWMMQPGEAEIVARRIREVLKTA